MVITKLILKIYSMTILGTNDYVNDINSMQSDITFEIYFQIGFHREAVSFVQNDLSLNGLLEKACLVVENQVWY